MTERTRSNWPRALIGLCAVVLAGCEKGCNQQTNDHQPIPGPVIPAEIPLSRGEALGRQRFLTFLDKEPLDLEESPSRAGDATKRLGEMFDQLDEKLRKQIEPGEIKCSRNGCARDVKF